MSDTFIKKHREHAEAKKLGRVTTRYDFDPRTDRFERITEREDAKHKPQLVTREMVPVGVGRAVMKPEK